MGDETCWSPVTLSAAVRPIHQHYKETHLENPLPFSDCSVLAAKVCVLHKLATVNYRCFFPSSREKQACPSN